jgi:hypothetical protein
MLDIKSLHSRSPPKRPTPFPRLRLDGQPLGARAGKRAPRDDAGLSGGQIDMPGSGGVHLLVHEPVRRHPHPVPLIRFRSRLWRSLRGRDSDTEACAVAPSARGMSSSILPNSAPATPPPSRAPLAVRPTSRTGERGALIAPSEVSGAAASTTVPERSVRPSGRIRVAKRHIGAPINGVQSQLCEADGQPASAT